MQADSGLAQSCRAVACWELCNNRHHVAPDCCKVVSSCIGGHGSAKMCQEFRVVVELNRPEEGTTFSSRQDAEGTCPDVFHVMPDGKFQEMNPTVGGRDTRKNCAESVLAVQLTKGDLALVVVVEGVEEQGGVLDHSGGKGKEISVKGCSMKAQVGFIEHRSALKGQVPRTGQQRALEGFVERHALASGKVGQVEHVKARHLDDKVDGRVQGDHWGLGFCKGLSPLLSVC